MVSDGVYTPLDLVKFVALERTLVYFEIITWRLFRMHEYTHAHMHACTHAHMHTCTHAGMRAQPSFRADNGILSNGVGA